MRFFLLTLLITSLGSFSGCINSKSESNQAGVIQVPCQISNSNGTIDCGKIPISTRDDVNKKLYPNCQIDFENFNDNSKKCLEQNDKRPADAYILGNLKYYGEFYDQNEVEGLKYIEYAAEHQNPQAKFWLAKKAEAEGDISSATILIKEAANLGNPLAIHSLGGRYIRGIGVDKNLDQALFLLNQSKEYIPASYSEIALIDIEKGDVEGFIENNNIAVEKKYWFALVDLSALYLGEMPNFEKYKNLKKADELANKLISHGVVVGDFTKAKVLQYQNKQTPEICQLYKNSFDNGYLPAGVNLGAEYLTGNNCEKNYKQALNIYSMLFKIGDNDIKMVSASNLGYMYLNGLGVPLNKNKSRECLEYAANEGYQPAIDMLNSLDNLHNS